MSVTMSTGFAMTQEQLEKEQQKAANILDNTPEVTWYDLEANPEAYSEKFVKFKATFLKAYDKWGGFEDEDGNLMILMPLTYRFKPGTEYTIAATFKVMKDNATPGKGRLAIFIYEKAHLPIGSEYGL